MLAREDNAYCEFGESYAPRLRSYFIRRGLPVADAEDLAVSCVTDIALKVDKYTYVRDGGFDAWVFTIAWHARVDCLAPQRNQVALTDDLPRIDDPEPNMNVVHAVEDAVAQLSAADRKVIEMRDLDDQLSYAEIAKRLDVSEGAVKVRHHRALKRLETILTNDPRLADVLRHDVGHT